MVVTNFFFRVIYRHIETLLLYIVDGTVKSGSKTRCHVQL